MFCGYDAKYKLTMIKYAEKKPGIMSYYRNSVSQAECAVLEKTKASNIKGNKWNPESLYWAEPVEFQCQCWWSFGFLLEKC